MKTEEDFIEKMILRLWKSAGGIYEVAAEEVKKDLKEERERKEVSK